MVSGRGGSPVRAVIQRVGRASVTSEGKVLGAIGPGLLVFVGVAPGDGAATVLWMAEKILRLRIFEDEAGKMNRSVEEVGGGILVISQFTLLGDAARGNRPSFTGAAAPAAAAPLYDAMVRHLREAANVPVATGSFGAEMEVALVNDGP